MRTTLASLFAIAVGTAAACGGDDGGYNPPGDDDGDDDPDAMRPDADPNAPDAATTPDAIGDGLAPLITPITPLPGGLVSGVMTLIVDVTDADEVTEVTATIALQEIAMMHGEGDTWVGHFDTAPLAGSAAPDIIVRAVDASGEMSELGWVIVLDNVGPLASMDPPPVRVRSEDGQCSHDFDPVGGDAPDDGESVLGGVELRARVFDRSNAGNVASTVYIARAGVGIVDVYVLDDTTRPLVVDTDGDGVCDDINPEIVPATTVDAPNEALVVALQGVAGGGSADFTADTFGGVNVGECTVGDDTDGPDPLCSFAEPGHTIAIDTEVDNAPQIFGIPAITENNCLGYFVDTHVRGIDDGWACAAVRTIDAVGNGNVSAPLRLCKDNDGSGDCLPLGEIAAEGVRPDCTGTVSGGVVTSTPCTAERFFESTVANEFEVIRP